MHQKYIQEYYPAELSYCYGCGRLNTEGLHLKSFWDDESGEAICVHMPDAKYIAIPGYVYGGLIASLIDCHATGTGAAAAYKAQGRQMGSEPPLRYVTASLHVDYLRPTPSGIALEIRGQTTEIKGRKAIVECTLKAGGEITAKGIVVVVQMPEDMFPATPPNNLA